MQLGLRELLLILVHATCVCMIKKVYNFATLMNLLAQIWLHLDMHYCPPPSALFLLKMYFGLSKSLRTDCCR